MKTNKRPNEIYTDRARLLEALEKAGFEVLDAKKYLTSEKYLQRGDILLNDTAHTAIEVGDGKVKSQKDTQKPTEKPQEKPTSTSKVICKLQPAMSLSIALRGSYEVTSSTLNVRYGADSSKYGVIKTIPKGSKVTCYGYYTDNGSERWLSVVSGNQTGFVCAKYVKKI